MSDLRELRDKVAAGEATTMAFDDAFAGFPDTFTPDRAEQCYFGSLDAARALHEALLPGWEWCVDGVDALVQEPHLPGRITQAKPVYGAAQGNPARAWLLAILDALIAKETDDAD